MLDPKSVVHSTVPAVDPLDIRHLWDLQSHYSTNSGMSFSPKAILQVCQSPSADPVAVWARTTLISILLQQGSLDGWLENGNVNPAVFAMAAVFPLPAGLQAFDANEFLAQLAAG